MSTITLDESYANALRVLVDQQVSEAVEQYLINRIIARIKRSREEAGQYETKYGMDYATFSRRIQLEEEFYQQVEKQNPIWEQDALEWEYWEEEAQDWTKKLSDILSLFITFEGPDGSGKTTQIQALYEYLHQRGHSVYLTREPGGTSIGDQIRKVLHALENTAMLPQAEALLYSASRAQIVGEVIRPHLERGDIVICDRYADSTMAYQGYGHGLDLALLKTITAFATGGLTPDLTIYLDIDVEEGLRRKRAAFQAGEAEWNRMDQQEVAFHRRVREGYLKMAAEEPERWLVLDATLPIEELQQAIRARVEEKLGS